MIKIRPLAIALIATGTIWAASTPNLHAQARTFDKPQTATSAAGAVTLNANTGIITTETSLTTAAGATYSLVVTDDRVGATSVIDASLQNGTNNGGSPVLGRIVPAAGSVTFVVHNAGASALNGSLKITFCILVP
jgi:hypothetical protein